MSETTCNTCRWWEAYSEPHGFCHGSAPHMVDGRGFRVWPSTMANDYCRAWMAKPKPKTAERKVSL